MTFSGYIHTLSEKFVYVPQMSIDFVPKNRSLPPSGAKDCARLFQIDVFYNTPSPGYLSLPAFQVSLIFGMLRGMEGI